MHTVAERLTKFFACLVMAPVVWLILVWVAVFMLVLPIVALIYPSYIKIGDKEDNGEVLS